MNDTIETPEHDSDLDNSEAFETFLLDAVIEAGVEADEYLSARSFADAGVMTRDNGIVVSVGGREFQVTIVRSR